MDQCGDTQATMTKSSASTKRPADFSSRASKKNKQEAIAVRKAANASTAAAASVALQELPRLPDDVFSVIFEMLLPRDLHSLALTSRALMNSLSPKTIIRASTLQGGHAATTMASLLELMERRQIHCPSPMRILRLALGRRCESPTCQRRVHTVRPHFGLFMCADCLKQNTTTRAVWKMSEVNHRDMLSSERTAFDSGAYGATKFWSAPYKTLGGELCGPVVTIADVDRVLKENKTVGEFEQFARDTASITYDNQKNCVDQLRTIFNEALEELTRANLVKSERKQQAMQVKELKLQSLVAQVAAMVDQEWKNECMTARWPSCSCCSGPVFESPVVNSLFKVVKDAPSKGTKKRLRMIAEDINTNFEIINDSGFRELTFLSEDAENFPFQAHLRAYLWEHTQDDRALKLTLTDVEALEADEAFLVLKRVLWSSNGCCLCVATHTMMHIMVSNGPDPGIYTRQANEMARQVWRKCGAITADTSDQLLEIYEGNYARARAEYNELSTAILAFLNDQTTFLYLEEPDKASDVENEAWRRTKAKVVNGMWKNQACWNLIHEGVDYDDLLYFVKLEAEELYTRHRSVQYPIFDAGFRFGGIQLGPLDFARFLDVINPDQEDDGGVDDEESDNEHVWYDDAD